MGTHSSPGEYCGLYDGGNGREEGRVLARLCFDGLLRVAWQVGKGDGFILLSHVRCARRRRALSQTRNRTCTAMASPSLVPLPALLETTTMAGRRVLIATGGTSGLGHEALFQLLSSPTPSSATWRVHLGARSTFDTSTLPRRDANKVTSSPLDLASFDSVRRFVQSVKEVLEDEGEGAGVDCLLLNAAVWKEGRVPGEGGWSEECTVNHFGGSHPISSFRSNAGLINGCDSSTLPGGIA